MDKDFIGNKITVLRTKKGVSEYDMSIDLNQDGDYIHRIAAEHIDISIIELMRICEYLEVEPRDFFDERIGNL